MDCRIFEDILADFHEGRLTHDRRSDAEDHLAVCSACRRLLDIVRGDIDILPEDAREALSRSILECTSGPACPGIESQLCDFVEGSLDKDQIQLMALHMDHCSSCLAIVRQLEELRDILPSFAEIPLDDSFAREVVRLTNGQRYRRKSPATRLLAWWNALIQRPRFTLEAAYIGTLALVFLFGSPFLRFRNLTFVAVPAAMQPASVRLISLWEDAKAPLANGFNAAGFAIASSGRTASAWLGNLGQDCAHASVSLAERGVRDLKEWRRKEAEALVSIWSRWSSRIPKI